MPQEIFDKMRILWFGKELDLSGHNIWRFNYSLRVKDFGISDREPPLYIVIEHLLLAENGKYILRVSTSQGILYEERSLGNVKDIDAGIQLLNLIYAYVNSYKDRARSFNAEVVEYINPLNAYKEIYETLENTKPPVFSNLLERIDIIDDIHNIYSQMILNVNWRYILRFESYADLEQEDV
ncbi:MAG: hypothetical protein QXJ51_00395 [Sulfolobales archaeon]